MIPKNKSVGPDKVCGQILNVGGGGEVVNPYLTRLLDIIFNNATIPSDCKKAIVVPIYKRGDRSGLKLQTSQFNLSGRQANGTHYSIVSEGNMG
jgi:hypothetical protein